MSHGSLNAYLVVASLLLVIGIFGIFLNRKNVIVIMMSIELILLAANLNFVAFSSALHDMVALLDGFACDDFVFVLIAFTQTETVSARAVATFAGDPS